VAGREVGTTAYRNSDFDFDFDVSPAAEESTVLETITKQQLVKTQETEYINECCSDM
jgi:hypothetical protein